MPSGTELISNKDTSCYSCWPWCCSSPGPHLDSWVFIPIQWNSLSFHLFACLLSLLTPPQSPCPCPMAWELPSSAWAQQGSSLSLRAARRSSVLELRAAAPSVPLSPLCPGEQGKPGTAEVAGHSAARAEAASSSGMHLQTPLQLTSPRAPCMSALVGPTGPGLQGYLEPACCPLSAGFPMGQSPLLFSMQPASFQPFRPSLGSFSKEALEMIATPSLVR